MPFLTTARSARAVIAHQDDGNFGPSLDMPAGAGENRPGRFLRDMQIADVDDDGPRLVERGLDDGVAQRQVRGGVEAPARREHGGLPDRLGSDGQRAGADSATALTRVGRRLRQPPATGRPSPVRPRRPPRCRPAANCPGPTLLASSPRQLRLLLQAAQRDPQRALDLFVARLEQGVRGPCMAHSAAIVLLAQRISEPLQSGQVYPDGARAFRTRTSSSTARPSRSGSPAPC